MATGTVTVVCIGREVSSKGLLSELRLCTDYDSSFSKVICPARTSICWTHLILSHPDLAMCLCFWPPTLCPHGGALSRGPLFKYKHPIQCPQPNHLLFGISYSWHYPPVLTTHRHYQTIWGQQYALELMKSTNLPILNLLTTHLIPSILQKQ